MWDSAELIDCVEILPCVKFKNQKVGFPLSSQIGDKFGNLDKFMFWSEQIYSSLFG